jgi:hypothetical protein
MCVDWIFPLKLPVGQSAAQDSEVSPLSQNPFPQFVPGVTEAALLETGPHPPMIDPIIARAIRVKEKVCFRG